MDANNYKPLIEQLREQLDARDVSVPKFEEQTGIPKDRVYKWLKRGTNRLDTEDAKIIENWLSGNMDNSPNSEVSLFDLKGIDQGQPIIQVVLNLSYIGKKNADSMDKMAATNQRNTEIIAALVAAMLPNSKFAAQLAVSQDDSQEIDEVPAIEKILGEEGMKTLKEQMHGGRKKVKDR